MANLTKTFQLNKTDEDAMVRFVAYLVKDKRLERPVKVKRPMTASSEDFDFVFVFFDKATVMWSDIAQFGGVNVS